MKTAAEVVDAIHGTYATGSKNGLENTKEIMRRLCPQTKVPVIHVAGTNGKGSTCAMLESILRCAGYRTGLYTSPFLQRYEERIRLNGRLISEEQMELYGNRLLEAAEGLQPTPFEMGTALALSAFEGEQVDAAVVEVGLGGRLDPTNVVHPCLCGIAAIGLDHMHFLGDTVEAIAGEKAGIIKQNVPVVCHPAEPSVAAVFAREAEKRQAPLRQLTMEQLLHWSCTAHDSTATYQLEETWQDVQIALPGEHQLTNVMTVLAMVEELRKQGFHLPEEAVRQGLAATVWPARLEWCGRILIDGAHNAQGVQALLTFVQHHLQDKHRVLLSGVLAEKLQPDMLTALAQLADTAVTVTPDSPRSMDAEEYAMHLRTVGVAATPAPSLEEGLKQAEALVGEDGIILAAGSLYFAGGLRNLLKLPVS